jgi:hypothetical protein
VLIAVPLHAVGQPWCYFHHEFIRPPPPPMPDLPIKRSAPSAEAIVPLSEARERVVALLSHHFAAGALTMDEFERRVSIVYGASGGAALDALVADLPAIATASATAPEEGRLSAFLSNTVRHGTMVVPRHLKFVAALANVELDLRDATFAPGVSEIEVSATMCNVEITMPPGVRVECTGSAFLGSFESRLRFTPASGAAAASDTIVRVLGRAILSSVDIHG